MLGLVGRNDRADSVAIVVIGDGNRRDRDLEGGEAIGVMRYAGHRFHRGGYVHATPTIAVCDRAFASEVVPHRVRILHETRVEDVKVLSPIANRFDLGHGFPLDQRVARPVRYR